MTHEATAQHSIDGWTVTCDCGKAWTYSHREAAEDQYDRHRRLEELRDIVHAGRKNP